MNKNDNDKISMIDVDADYLNRFDNRPIRRAYNSQNNFPDQRSLLIQSVPEQILAQDHDMDSQSSIFGPENYIPLSPEARSDQWP